ncbi:hypothetical protein PBY51_014753 [Eleginops maclovinus]|uniref:Uncharacterized protein n=1 Tax=Eleginops maclovinus TaxID=56733 RepID=A0AAN8AFT6_ELEMC|nr:hypothetical protein PBY51_014753 [Eleginops maclovinus]
MPRLLTGRTSGTALAAIQPNGWREASPETNASLLATTNLGLSGKQNTLAGGEGLCKESMKKWKTTTSEAYVCTGDDLDEPNVGCTNHWGYLV